MNRYVNTIGIFLLMLLMWSCTLFVPARSSDANYSNCYVGKEMEWVRDTILGTWLWNSNHSAGAGDIHLHFADDGKLWSTPVSGDKSLEGYWKLNPEKSQIEILDEEGVLCEGPVLWLICGRYALQYTFQECKELPENDYYRFELKQLNPVEGIVEEIVYLSKK